MFSNPRSIFEPALLAAFAITLCSIGSGCEKNGGANGNGSHAPKFPGDAEMEEARAAAEDGRMATAADKLAIALTKVEEAGPLRIKSLTLVEDNVRGYGLYTPVEDNTLPPGKPMLLYFEPSGMNYAREGEFWKVDLSADLAILSPDGLVLQKEKDFLSSTVESLRPNREIQFVLRLQTVGIQEGDYVAEITLRDRNSKEAVTDRVPVKFRVP